MAPENGPQPSAESLAQRGVDSSLGQCGANVGPDPLARFRVHGQAGAMGEQLGDQYPYLFGFKTTG